MSFQTSSRFVLVAAALLCVPGAEAGNVFKCKDAKGGTIYQNHACAADHETLEQRQFEDQAAAAPAPTHTYREVPAVAGSTTSQAAARRKHPQISRPPLAGGTSGYQCSDGRRQWVSDTPCPRTVTRHQTERVHTGTYNGVHVSRLMTTAETAPVSQQGLDSRQLCRQVNSGTSASSSDDAGAADGYERNKLRDRKGC